MPSNTHKRFVDTGLSGADLEQPQIACRLFLKQPLWLPLMENMTCQACAAGSGVVTSSYPALNSDFMTAPVAAWEHRGLESLWIPWSHPVLEAVVLFLHIIPSRSSSSLPQALFEHFKPLRRPAIKLSRCLMAHNKYWIFGKEAHNWVCQSWLRMPSQTHKLVYSSD